ncbi:hypothetical protein [Halalkalibacter akibai]|uniref:Uncharacterized protein n=1 Tax=Halalkalibacter akibai (strain ATCC 43226 / DSM 21942 / CIP 109018 / JCM 9157 / 1139) TaxID=1236973 RepID=W4QV10_HALA3|nr:hypothetical protein [Halalkalibacter akibai]GAE35174.1 hypothetical protein JCM9157_2271 [Halalkalibacter akibai JCM 9157]
MGDWNKQASRNNNIQPDLSFKNEELTEKKIQLDVQEQIGMEALARKKRMYDLAVNNFFS